MMTKRQGLFKSMSQLLGVSLLASLCAPGFAASNCGSPYDSGGVGPFDYHDSNNAEMLRKVESFHFNSSIKANSLRGARQPDPGNDLDYTLRAFPNHPEALYAMAVHQMHLRRSSRPDYIRDYGNGGQFKSAACYFERAKVLRPDDASIDTSHGMYLQRKGDLKGALARFEEAARLNPESAKAQYNLGLINYALKRYDASLKHAKLAYGRGYRKPHLKQRLQARGKWKD